MTSQRILTISGVDIRPGDSADIQLKVGESAMGDPITTPLRVFRAKKRGPTVFLTGAIHGDETNGTGTIRELLSDPPKLLNGSLICAPLVNVFGFRQHQRYMPDRRDLNRCFPGIADGSLTSRFAAVIFKEIVLNSDYGIDLHSAATGRTNFPNVRGDTNNAGVRMLAEAFGCELIVHGRGPDKSFRRSACDAGVPTIILEAGEVLKFEPSVIETGVLGITNVLVALGMIEGEVVRPVYQTNVRKTTWVRAELGGLLRFHVTPGELVEAGQPIASNESVFGDAQTVILTPVDGIVLGLTTNPSVMPGDPVCHIAVPRKSLRTIRRALSRSSETTLAHRVRSDLATNISVTNDVRVPQ